MSSGSGDQRMRWFAYKASLALAVDEGDVYEYLQEQSINKILKAFYDNPAIPSLFLQRVNNKFTLIDKSQNIKLNEGLFYVTRLNNKPIMPKMAEQELVSGYLSGEYVTEIIRLLSDVIFTLDASEAVSGLERDFLQNFSQIKQIVDQKVQINHIQVDMPGLQDFIKSYKTLPFDDFVSKYINVDHKFIDQLRYWIQLLNIEIQRIQQQMVKKTEQTQLQYYRQLNTIYNYLLIELNRCEYIDPTIKFLQQYKYKDGEQLSEGQILRQHQKQIKVKADQTAQIVSYLNKIYQITQQFQLLEPELMSINIKQLFETLGNLFTCSNDFKSNQQVSEYLTELWDNLLESIKKQLSFSGKDLLTAFKSVGHFKNQEHYVISIYKQSIKQFMQLKFQLGFQVSETQVFEKFNQFIERLKQIDFILSTENDFGQLDNCTLSGLDEIQKQRKTLVKPFTALSYDVFDQYGTQFLIDLEKYQNGITVLEQNILQTLKIPYQNPWVQIYKMHQLYSVLNRPNLINDFLSFYDILLNEYSISQQKLYNSLANNEIPIQEALVQHWREKKLFDYYKKVFVPDNPDETQIDKNIRMERYGKFYNQYIGDVRILHAHQPLFYKYNQLCKKVCKYHESIKLRMKEAKKKFITDSNQEAEMLLDGLRQPVLLKDQYKRVNVIFPVTQYFQFLKSTRFIFLTLHNEPQDTTLMLYNNNSKLLASYYRLSYYIRQMYHSQLNNKLFNELVKILKAQLIMNIQTGVQNMTWTSTRIESYVEDVGTQCQSVSALVQRINLEVEEGIYQKINTLGDIQLVIPSDGLATFQQFQKQQNIHIQKQVKIINQLQSEISQRLLSIIQLISAHFNQKIQKIITGMLLTLISHQEDVRKMARISLTQQQKQQQQMQLQSTVGAEKIRLIVENIYKDVKRQTLQAIVSIYTNSLFLISKMGHLDLGPIEIFINTGKTQYSLYPTADQVIQETQVWITHIINSSKEVALWNSQCLVNQNMLKMIEANRDSMQKQLIKIQANTLKQKPQMINSPNHTDPKQNSDDTQLREPQLTDQQVIAVDVIEQQSYSTVQSNCNLYNIIGQSKKIVTQQLVIISTVKRAFQSLTQKLEKIIIQYNDIYSMQLNPKQHLSYVEYQQQIQEFQDKQNEIQQNIGTNIKDTIFQIQLKQIKQHFISQLQKGQQISLQGIQQQAYQAVKHTANFYNTISETLDIEPESLDDIRAIMKAIQRFADYQAQSDMTEYNISLQLDYLRSCGCKLNSDVMDSFEKLGQSNIELQNKAGEKHQKLKEISPVFQDTLRQEIAELQAEEKAFIEEYDTKGPLEPKISSQEASNRTQYYYNLFKPLSDKLTACMEGEQLFGLPITPFPRLMQLRQDFKLLTMLYQLYNDINTKLTSIGTQNFFKLNTESLQDEIKQFQMRCYKLPKSMRQFKAYDDLKARLNDLEQLQPILAQLQAPELIERHWTELARILGKQEIVQAYYDPETFKLSTLLSCDLIKFADDIEEVYNGAIREGDIEKKFRALYTTWTAQNFEFVQGNGKFLFEPKITADLIGTIDESMQLLGTLKSNKYNKPFRSQITVLYANLTQVDEYLTLWLQVQQNFVYLEAVFTSGDISRQLPAEAKRFANIEKTFVRLMNVAQTIRNVIQLCCSDETHKTLPILQEQIEVVQKNLSSYLEQKRNKFPRFCFVSDSVLIEILGNQSELSQIVQFLPQLFDSLFSVGIAKNAKNTITSIQDRNGENVDLTTPFVVQGIIEEWLHGLIEAMRKTLKQSMSDAQDALAEAQNNPQAHGNTTPGGGELSKLVMDFPAQTALVCLQIQWTTTCETCFKAVARGDRRGVELMSTKIQKMLDQLIKLTRQRTMPRVYLRTAIETMITIMVHQKDIFDELREQRVNNSQDFTWTRQARAYWDQVTQDCYFQITDINFPYQYEYLGVNERLVVTPLTDRCYITLAQAIGLNRGGAPAGPAGTGKTETCKDLGRLVGQYVIVQNCSDQMDYQVLGKIFRGIAQGGIYGDFDEFNRIDLDVMSVAAQQLNCIFQALQAKKEKTEYTDGTIITVKPSCAYFITMNPGYAGRQELLENLKALFRVCSMYVQRDSRFILIYFYCLSA